MWSPPREERLAQVRKELDDQNERWNLAMRRLAELCDARVAVSLDFFEQLDALARTSSAETKGLRA